MQVRSLIAGASKELGSATLTRAAANGRDLCTLDDRGRLVWTSIDKFQWEVRDLGYPVVDLEMAENGTLLLCSNSGRVFGLLAAEPKDLGIRATALQRIGKNVAATDTGTGRLETLGPDAKALGIAAGGRDEAAKLGDQPYASLADEERLYLAGPGGAVVRDPLSHRSVPVYLRDSGAAASPKPCLGIERWEKRGEHVLAWREGRAFRVIGDDRAMLEPVTPDVADVVLGPKGQLWSTVKDASGTSLKSTGPGKMPALFEREGQLDAVIRDAAPFGDNRVLLAGRDNTLLCYETQTHSLRSLGKPGDGWRFARVGESIFVVLTPRSGEANSTIFRVEGNPPAVEGSRGECASISSKTRAGSRGSDNRDRSVRSASATTACPRNFQAPGRLTLSFASRMCSRRVATR